MKSKTERTERLRALLTKRFVIDKPRLVKSLVLITDNGTDSDRQLLEEALTEFDEEAYRIFTDKGLPTNCPACGRLSRLYPAPIFGITGMDELNLIDALLGISGAVAMAVRICNGCSGVKFFMMDDRLTDVFERLRKRCATIAGDVRERKSKGAEGN